MYRKFTAAQIFDGNRFLPAGKVLITSAEGKIIDVVATADAGDNVEHLPGILTPGFINCHCHLELSHMKGAIPERTGLVNFVQQVMAIRGATAAHKQLAMENAAQEMWDNGIAAVGDICNTMDAIPVKQISKLRWNNFIEVSGFVDAAASKRVADAKVILDAHNILLPHQNSSLTPHAPYSVSKTLFQILNSETAGQLISIHNQESAEENKLYQNGSGEFLNLYKNFGIDTASFLPTGKSSLQSWLPYFTKQRSILLVHDIYTNEDDLLFTKQLTTNEGTQIFYCLCPAANIYIENALPDVALLQKYDCAIVLGTDSYASNKQLSIWEEIKILRSRFTALPLATLLQWATINGARALHMDDVLGSFEKGKQPGIVVIEEEKFSRRIL